MAKHRTAFLNSHTSSRRDSWWYLEQDEDGTLHVTHENLDDPASGEHRTPINQFLISGASNAKVKLQALIDRMFEQDDA